MTGSSWILDSWSEGTSSRTGQDLLDRMEILNAELQLQPGESDATRGLLALNMAQDYMESLFATQPDLLGDSVGTVTTTANFETTSFPSNLLRLDRLQLLDDNSKPLYDLDDIRRTGGHVRRAPWPISIATSTGGRPAAYYTDGRYIYWAPLPDATYSVRWYGFASADDITADGAFAYRDICMTPIATLAVRLMQTGLGDDPTLAQQLAQELFQPVITTLGNFQRTGAPGLNYRYYHNA